MMKQKVTRTASFSLFFLLSGFALAHAQVPPSEPTEPPSRLSMFAHDVSSWVDHIITDAKHIITDADHTKRMLTTSTPMLTTSAPALTTIGSLVRHHCRARDRRNLRPHPSRQRKKCPRLFK
jgi:hypothetical protein